MSQATLYRWRKRFDPHDLHSLKDRSRRPKHVRSARWPLKLIQDVKAFRETDPRWGKDKLVVLVCSKGHLVSTSTVGRILSYLKKHGRLVDPKRVKSPHYPSPAHTTLRHTQAHRVLGP